ncbi:hypothetical protein OP10G_4027 [Fimbriimonas ginsengisoli Gsoil 348]|uniref:Uncharacterized protein n=1 Tax=Fimbriimonas ginsengisoli Gsoil 348 TaxID=661478 RepID=A0A068NX83_FIMGI|nr:hypothetical protein OP10G_4027 [Fimbriimonas ginsengisoli Gsoil 348]
MTYLGVTIEVIGRANLIDTKLAAGWPVDIEGVKMLKGRSEG